MPAADRRPSLPAGRNGWAGCPTVPRTTAPLRKLLTKYVEEPGTTVMLSGNVAAPGTDPDGAAPAPTGAKTAARPQATMAVVRLMTGSAPTRPPAQGGSRRQP